MVDPHGVVPISAILLSVRHIFRSYIRLYFMNLFERSDDALISHCPGARL